MNENDSCSYFLLSKSNSKRKSSLFPCKIVYKSQIVLTITFISSLFPHSYVFYVKTIVNTRRNIASRNMQLLVNKDSLVY